MADEKTGTAEAEEFEIEVVSDIPESDKPRLPEGETPKAVEAGKEDEDDLEGYSEAVQKRIKKLTFTAHEERRQREAAERVREEAIKYARSVSDENKSLSTRLNSGSKSVVESRVAALTAQVETARAAYRKAYEAGDTDAVLAANESLMQAQTQLTQVKNWRPRPVIPQATPEEYAQQHNIDVSSPKLNTQQSTWLGDNDWFGKDEIMTGAAYGLHEKLVRSGVDPNSESYYAEIDKGMRSHFPNKFQASSTTVNGDARHKASVVAPATRDTSKPRKIRLTESQMALARRLGVPPEKYAAQLLKDGNDGR